MPVHVSSTMCLLSRGQNFIIQYLVSSHYPVGGRPVHRCTGRPPTVVMIPDAV